MHNNITPIPHLTQLILLPSLITPTHPSNTASIPHLAPPPPHPTLPRLTSPHPTLPLLTSPHPTLPLLTAPPHSSSPHLAPSHSSSLLLP
ncbi:hypothetical protein Pmani_015476 [Petrolisthes manimaculis]|uniref:Uncharacterized protein n=1 Tax=Petrolisthes manimaculis TaxID=1843537 RepID=A0AAE1PRU9_9EUCA|nr:hypothetical protein Pmani_015476 [Petrolisthes manimaculis]